MSETIKVLESINIKEKSRVKSNCVHARIELDCERRLIRCQDCDVYLDAFDYLVLYWRRLFNMSDRISKIKKDEMLKLCAQVEALKREKHNLKAFINRHKSA